MKVNLPVPMFPLAATASKSGGFVVAVLIGLALFMADRKRQELRNTNSK